MRRPAPRSRSRRRSPRRSALRSDARAALPPRVSPPRRRASRLGPPDGAQTISRGCRPAAVERATDEVAQHLLGDGEVGDHARAAAGASPRSWPACGRSFARPRSDGGPRRSASRRRRGALTRRCPCHRRNDRVRGPKVDRDVGPPNSRQMPPRCVPARTVPMQTHPHSLSKPAHDERKPPTIVRALTASRLRPVVP